MLDQLKLLAWRYSRRFLSVREKFPVGTREALASVLAAGTAWYFVEAIGFGLSETRTFLLAAAGIAATVLTITFGLLGVMQQSLLSIVPGSRFQKYVADGKQNRAYLAMVVSVLVLIVEFIGAEAIELASGGGAAAIVVGSAVAVVGFTMALARWQYDRVTRLVNPFNLIDWMRSDSLALLDLMSRRATLAAESIVAKDASKEVKEAAVWSKIPTRRIQIELISFLVVADQFAERDSLAVSAALGGFGNVAAHYLEIRSRSSTAIVRADLSTESDSQELFMYVLEQLNSSCLRFVNARQFSCARAVIGVYGSLLEAASKVRFVGSSNGVNPLFEQIIGYQMSVTKLAMAAGDEEVAFAAIRSVLAAQLRAIEGGDPHASGFVLSGLAEIEDRSWKPDMIYLLREVVKALCQISDLAIRHPDLTFGHDEIQQMLARIHAKASNSQVLMPKDEERLTELRRLIYEPQLENLCRWASDYDQADDPKRQQLETALAGYLSAFADETRAVMLRSHLDEDSGETIARFIGRASSTILDVCERGGNARAWRHLRKPMEMLVHLPGFWGDSEVSAHDEPSPVRRFVEQLSAIAGRLVLTNTSSDLAMEALRVATRLAERMIPLPGYGFFEPRLMTNVFAVGALAKAKGQLEVTEVAVELLRDFDAKRTGSPKENSLKLSEAVLEFKEECIRGKEPLLIASRMERLVNSALSVADIDALMLDVWPAPLGNTV